MPVDRGDAELGEHVGDLVVHRVHEGGAVPRRAPAARRRARGRAGRGRHRRRCASGQRSRTASVWPPRPRVASTKTAPGRAPARGPPTQRPGRGGPGRGWDCSSVAALPSSGPGRVRRSGHPAGGECGEGHHGDRVADLVADSPCRRDACPRSSDSTPSRCCGPWSVIAGPGSPSARLPVGGEATHLTPGKVRQRNLWEERTRASPCDHRCGVVLSCSCLVLPVRSPGRSLPGGWRRPVPGRRCRRSTSGAPRPRCGRRPRSRRRPGRARRTAAARG